MKEEVIQIVDLLREERILADTKDLAAFIRKKETHNCSLSILKSFYRIEDFLLTGLIQGVFTKNVERIIHLKELNEQAEENGCQDVTPDKLKTVINFWAIKSWIKQKKMPNSKDHIAVLCLQERETLKEKLAVRHELAQFIVEYLYDKSNSGTDADEISKEEVLVEFSVFELKEAFEGRLTMFIKTISQDEIEDALFYLSRIGAVKIEGGFLVIYNPLTIERIEQNNMKKFNVEDYQKLNEYYENKVQQIHIVGEYARKMVLDYKDALQFTDDYFQMNYNSFLHKYFKGSRLSEIRRNITPAKFRQLFGELSPTQLKIINDKEAKFIVVAAGPGSGKTRILVHKLASRNTRCQWHSIGRIVRNYLCLDYDKR